jgi:hypothetical protein
MMRLAIVLMMLAATFDSIPVAALVRSCETPARMACCCKNACECRQCAIHHPRAAGSPLVFKMAFDCLGCSPAGPAPMSPVSFRIFVPASTVALVPAAEFTPLAGAGAPPPAATPSRPPDPPPRSATARTSFSFS